MLELKKTRIILSCPVNSNDLYLHETQPQENAVEERCRNATGRMTTQWLSDAAGEILRYGVAQLQIEPASEVRPQSIWWRKPRQWMLGFEERKSG